MSHAWDKKWRHTFSQETRKDHLEDLGIGQRIILSFSCGGVRLKMSRLGTSATIWPIVPAPVDRW
jgi:hypothetical protein